MTQEDLIEIGLGDGKLAVIGRLVAALENGQTKPFETRHYLKTIDCHVNVKTWGDGEEMKCSARLNGRYPKPLLDKWTQAIMGCL